MSSAEIIRAWKDPEYRSTLSVVPIHPAGQIALSDSALSRTTARTARGFETETVRQNKSLGDLCHDFTLRTNGGCCNK